MYDIQNRINDINALRKLDNISGNIVCIDEKDLILVNDDIRNLEFPPGVFDYVVALITADTNVPNAFENLFVFTEDGSDPTRPGVSSIPNPNPAQIPNPAYPTFIAAPGGAGTGTHDFIDPNYVLSNPINTGDFIIDPAVPEFIDDPNDLTIEIGIPAHGALIDKGGIIEVKGLENVNKFKFVLAAADDPGYVPGVSPDPVTYRFLNVKFYVNKISE